MALRDAIAATAAVPFALGVLVITVGVLRVPFALRRGPAELAGAIGLGLELLLAAGLLRLSALDDAGALALVAAIVVLRKVIVRGIGFAVGALGTAEP